MKLFCGLCQLEHEWIFCDVCNEVVHPLIWTYPAGTLQNGEAYGPRRIANPVLATCDECRNEKDLATHPEGPLWASYDDKRHKVILYCPVEDSEAHDYGTYVNNMGDRRCHVRALIHGRPWQGIEYSDCGTLRLMPARDRRRTKDLREWVLWGWDTRS